MRESGLAVLYASPGAVRWKEQGSENEGTAQEPMSNGAEKRTAVAQQR